jgi:DNA-binding NtrC family response regulator
MLDSLDETTSKRLKVIIIEDDEDNLNLYNDYLCHKGHHVVNTYHKTDSIMTDIEKDTPDVYLLDYKLPGNKNGIEVATEILNKFPKAPILFITAHESLRNEMSKLPKFHDKNIEFLTKPVKLYRMESSMLNLVNKK